MTKKISSGRKPKVDKNPTIQDTSAGLLANPATKKIVIQKLLSVSAVRQLIIKTIIEKTLT